MSGNETALLHLATKNQGLTWSATMPKRPSSADGACLLQFCLHVYYTSRARWLKFRSAPTMWGPPCASRSTDCHPRPGWSGLPPLWPAVTAVVGRQIVGRDGARPQYYGRRAGSREERPATPASSERQVTAAADIGPGTANVYTQSFPSDERVVLHQRGVSRTLPTRRGSRHTGQC
jgi:hypothetical protein